MMLNDGALQILRELFVDLGAAGSLDNCLKEISDHVTKILEGNACTIALLNDDEIARMAPNTCAGFGDMPTAPTRLRSSMKSAYPPIREADGQIRESDTHTMYSTIVLSGKTIGIIQAASSRPATGFTQDDLDLLSILTPLITKSIQVIQLQHLLRSNFTQLSLLRTNEDSVRDILSGAIHNPNQIARMLAKSFYREMINAGFSFNQILFAATEVISQLSASVRKHRSRRQLSDSAQINSVEDIMRLRPPANRERPIHATT